MYVSGFYLLKLKIISIIGQFYNNELIIIDS